MRKLPLLIASVLLSACVVRARTAPPPPGGGGPPPPPGGGEVRQERQDDRRDAVVDANSKWDKLGEQWVEGGRDHDVIVVGKQEGRYRKIKIIVEHSALEMFDVRVTLGDGAKFSPPTRLVFAEGSGSRIIDIPGKARFIQQVEFKYGNLPGGGKAQVELWGLHE